MPGRNSTLAGGVVVVVVTLALVGAIRWAGPSIYDGDGWYHVKYAEILRHDGVSRSFPWFQESFLKDRFTDFNLLYHLLLIPFTAIDPLTGARIASVLFAAVTMGLFWGTARALRVPWPALWSVGLLAFAPELTYRLTYTRPLVLAIGLGVAGTGAILLGKRRLLFVLAFLYTHLHCSYHFLPFVALLHDAVRDPVEGETIRGRFRMTLWAMGGVAAGSLLTPYFPNNLRMWWVTNVEVLRASWAMGDALRVGTEMLPVGTTQLLAANLGVFVVFFAAILLIAFRGGPSEQVRTLLPVAAGFLGLSFLSQRFAELWAPYTFLLAAVAVRDALGDREIVPPVVRRIAPAVLMIVVAAGLARTWAEDRAAAAAEDPPEYLEAGAWIEAHIPAGETIFNLGWDEFPQLFYADATHNYLIGQDATFMWATDPERTRIWSAVARGQVPDLHAAIRTIFGCRFVFVPRRYVTFTKLTGRDPRFREVWSNGVTSVVRVDDDGHTIDRWAGRGWQPDPWHRYYDVALDAEPGDATDSEVRHDGAAPGVAGFVDLARVFDVPSDAAGACAVVSSTLDVATGGPVELGLTTDDEVKLYANGALLYARSPYRTPPPGSPGGPPVSLDAVFAGATRGVPEQVVTAELRAGANELVVKACRYGDDFGFVLRRRESAASSPPTAATR